MRTFFSALAFCGALSCAAQSTRSPLDFKTAVGFNPTVLAATDMTAMISAEQNAGGQLAIVLDAGYVFGSYYFQDMAPRRTRGFALRPGVKWYAKTGGSYYQFQFAYKQVDYTMHDWLGKACVNGVPSYEQLQDFVYRKKTFSSNVLAGQLFPISNTMLLDLYAGFGVKIKHQQPTEQNACYRNEDFQERRTTATVALGVKFLIALQ